jgi:hypothetical protein
MIDKIYDHLYRKRSMYLSIGITTLVVWNIASSVRCGIMSLSHGISIFGNYVTAFAIFFAAYQFKANHDWNRRQLAITEAKNIREEAVKNTLLLDKKFHYISRKKHEKIDVDTIHKAMCELNPNGSLKYYGRNLKIDHANGGDEVDKALSHLIGAFEYLSTGIRQGIFDEEVIYRLYGGPLMRAAGIFDDYITHLNKDMYEDRGGRIYENLRFIAGKFEARETAKAEKEREKTG